MRSRSRGRTPAARAAGAAPVELPPDAQGLLVALARHGVDFVLVGAHAGLFAGDGELWGDEAVTVVPSRYARNLERLSAALRDLRAGTPGDLHPSAPGPAALRRARELRLATDYGDLVIDFEPPATAGYVDLFDDARAYALAGDAVVDVADRADLVRIAVGAADAIEAV